MKSKPILIAATLALVAGALVVALGPCAQREAESRLRVELPVTSASDQTTDGSSTDDSQGKRSNEARQDRATFTPIPRWGDAPIRLVVVERDSGQRLPGASVSLLEADARTYQFGTDGAGTVGPDPEKVLRERGRTVVADEHAEVEIPASHEAWLVSGRSNDLFGWVRFVPHTAGERRLELERQHDLTVHVVDDRGSPCAGIEVGLCRCRVGRNDWEGETDATGSVVLHNLTSIVRDASLDDERALEVHAEFPGEHRIVQWIDPRHPPVEPLLLTLPAQGRLHLIVIDAQGRLWHLPGTASVHLELADEPAGNRGPPKLWARVPFEDAASIEIPVPLGGELAVNVDFDVGGGASGTIVGPRTRGEVISAQLALNPKGVFFTGRIVGDDGQPIADAAFRLESFSCSADEFRDHWGDPLLTDADGRFAFTKAFDVGWILERGSARSRRGAALDFKRLPRSASGIQDLGDVRLADLQPLVSGRVEDEEGHPIAAASVQLSWERSPKDKRRIVVGNEYPTGALGEFSFYGPCIDGKFVLSGSSEEARHCRRYLEESFACRSQLGERTLRLETLGAIEGEVLLDDGRGKDDFGLLLSPDTGESHEIGPIISGSAHVKILGIRRGEQTLSIVEMRNGAIVLQIPEIVVRAGEVTHDPRLEPLDLRHVFPTSVIRETELLVVDESGRGVPFGDVWLLGVDPALDERWSWANGRVRLPASGLTNVDVWAPGCRMAHFDAANLPERIVLHPACDVLIALDPARQAVDAGVRFIVDLRSLDGEQQGRRFHEAREASPSSVRVGESDAARFPLAVPGQYEMTVRAITEDAASGAVRAARWIQITPPAARIEVLDRDGLQRFDAHLDPDELRAFVESLDPPKNGR